MSATACPTTTSKATPWCSASRSPTPAAPRSPPAPAQRRSRSTPTRAAGRSTRSPSWARPEPTTTTDLVQDRQGRRSRRSTGSRSIARATVPTASPTRTSASDNLAVSVQVWRARSRAAARSRRRPRYNFNFRLDANLNRFVMVDRGVDGVTGGNNPSEQTAALWAWSDANDTAYCGSSHPFTGKGWEGNYDSGVHRRMHRSPPLQRRRQVLRRLRRRRHPDLHRAEAGRPDRAEHVRARARSRRRAALRLA